MVSDRYLRMEIPLISVLSHIETGRFHYGREALAVLVYVMLAPSFFAEVLRLHSSAVQQVK